MRKRIFAAFLAVLMLASVLAACKKNKGGDEEQSTETQDNRLDSSLSILPEKDYGGAGFVITYRDLYNSIDDMLYTEEHEDVLEEAKYKRALKVEDTYKISLEPTFISGDWSGDKAVTSLAAGDHDFDIIMPHSHIAWGSYIVEGYALEWTENMKYNHLDQEWWDQGAYKCLSVGGKYYTMLGDSSWKLLGSSVGILFNKDVFDDIGEAYPYDDVDNLTWTFDKFNQVAAKTVKDLNGDNTIELGKDRYGYTTGLYMGPMGFLWTTGQGIVTKNNNDIPELTLYNDTTVSLYDKFFDMMDNEGFHIYNDRDSFNTSFHQEFVQGKVAMIDTMIENISQLRDMYNWGIVPYPMFDDSVGRYYSTADAGVHSPIIPYNTEDVERTSIILEALTIEGHNQVIPAFYDITLQIKYTDDENSKRMLDLISSTRTFDLGYYTGQCAGDFCLIGTKLFLEKTNLSVFYNQKAELVQSDLDDFIAILSE